MPVFHAYRRVSDGKQLEGSSLEAQDSILRKYHAFKYPEHLFLDYCDPAVSALIPWFEREAGEVLWSQISSGDVVVVATVDRAFRSLKDLCNSLDKLEERKAILHCLDLPVDVGTIEGRAFLQVFAVFKELERKTIGKRVRMVNDLKREKGLPVCSRHVTIGYKRHGKGKDAKYVPNREEREFGQMIVVMHEHDGKSIPDIVLYLSRERNHKRLAWQGGLSYGYLNRLYYATKAGFPLPDGKRLPGNAAEYLEWRKENEATPPV